METWELFEEICRAMTEPAFYPHSVSRLEIRETHISTVFLTGAWVYKMKKPVNFGFLDFRSLQARRHFCEEEVVLNRRLSRGVYEGVVTIRRDATGGFHLEGSGEAAEYAVKMRQLPDDTSLKALLCANRVSSKDMEELGRHLADFYELSPRHPAIDHFGHPDVVAFNMEENFRQIEPFVGDLVSAERWEFIRQVSRTFFQNWRELFEQRVRAGRIRDGHGDLRTDHIYLHNGIQIIDCIEFNDRFRYGDVVSDMAFLHMDMEHLGEEKLSIAGLAAYAERADDHGIYTLLDFYAAYRAVVKVKVACLRSSEVSRPEERLPLKEEARQYLAQAYRYSIQFSRPTLWVFMGLPATGKSSLAEAVARVLSLPIYQSDRVRKEWAEHHPDHSGVVPYDQGMYRAEMRNRVYGRMLALAQEQLKHGHSVILDATFSHSRWRNEARQLASDLDTSMLFVECACGEHTMVGRLKEREGTSGFSDARLVHLPEMIREFEPVVESLPVTHLRVDTDQPFSKVLAAVLSEGYALKCAQVGRLLSDAA